ncbi:MAG: hypothetical protein IPN49_16320 [Saprospiraceae bacterium]|nr:hypothetical protein [Saprospiraceae bacterium]
MNNDLTIWECVQQFAQDKDLDCDIHTLYQQYKAYAATFRQFQKEKEAVKMKYNLSKGCPYCINLKCTKEPLLEFECVKNKELKIKNAGACFVAELDNGKNIIIENCPDFAVRSICSRN